MGFQPGLMDHIERDGHGFLCTHTHTQRNKIGNLFLSLYEKTGAIKPVRKLQI
jgi:hypothetical protein